MFPIALNLEHLSVVLVGEGFLLERRLRMLDEDGARKLAIFSANPSDELLEKAGTRLARRLPTADELQAAHIILVAGLPRQQAEEIATQARAAGKLVNVEDINDLCDFYFTANVRRGDLLVAVSTSGASPTLARKLRDAIAVRFGPEWEDYTRQLATLRQDLRKKGASMRDIIDATEAMLKKNGWLKEVYPQNPDEDAAA